MMDIRLFHLGIHRSYVSTLARINRSLHDAFEGAARAGDAEELEVILRPAKYSRGHLSAALLKVVRRLTRDNALRQSARVFRVTGFDPQSEKVEEVDVLNDKLIVTKRIVRLDQRTRALESGSAYHAIHEAYDELRDELTAAAGVLV